jgi:hypothetical protein
MYEGITYHLSLMLQNERMPKQMQETLNKMKKTKIVLLVADSPAWLPQPI